MGICNTEQGFMVRITDKMSRLSSFLDSGKMHVKDESFHDTVIDVINYMVLLAAYEDKESKEYAEERNEEDKVNRLISKNWSEHAETQGLRCKDS